MFVVVIAEAFQSILVQWTAMDCNVAILDYIHWLQIRQEKKGLPN
jgi:hypothetical protein